jgi:prevent-host-death family protein
MAKSVSAKEARSNFSDLLGFVHYSKQAVIVQKRGRPFVVIINPEDYDRLLRERRERLAVFDEVASRNPNVTPAEAAADAAREIASLRREQQQREETLTKSADCD